MREHDLVWIFHGEGAQFACAAFASKASAISWISSAGVTGVLTAYRIGISAYDWATERGVFSAKRDDQRSAKFVQRFTSASQDHHHFEDGKPTT